MGTFEASDFNDTINAFYSSFYFSQGRYADQHHIFDMLGYTCRRRDARAGIIAVAASTEFDELMDGGYLLLPRPHLSAERIQDMAGSGASDPVTAMFRDRWRDFRSRLEAPIISGEQAYQHRLKVFAGHMIEADLYWSAKGRPDRVACASRFKSLYREHVLMAEPCGSHLLDAIARDMGAVDAMLPDTPRKLAALEVAWQSHFPGEPFNPAA